MTPEIKGFLLVASAKIVAVVVALILGVMMVAWAERRVSAFIQLRLGPNRVGPQGLLQLLADGIKSLFKEETHPAEADYPLFLLAPALKFFTAMLLFAVVPFAAPLPLSFDFTLPLLGRFVHQGVTSMMLVDVPVGFLFILAISSLGVYGIVLAGWSSASKYAFLGGLRASAQMVSYEITLGMSLVVVMMLAGSVTLTDIITLQQSATWLVLPATFAFVLFAISALAETNRLPFDLPEAETELVTGYHTEYSSLKLLMFFIGEYTAVITMSALMATVFFGGWDIPFTTWDDRSVGSATVAAEPSVLKTLATGVASFIKTASFVFWFIWVRWTSPRFRFDQLMALGWKVLLPAALIYIFIMAAAVRLRLDEGAPLDAQDCMVLFAVNLVVLTIVIGTIDRGRMVVGAGERRRHTRDQP